MSRIETRGTTMVRKTFARAASFGAVVLAGASAVAASAQEAAMGTIDSLVEAGADGAQERKLEGMAAGALGGSHAFLLWGLCHVLAHFPPRLSSFSFKWDLF